MKTLKIKIPSMDENSENMMLYLQIL